MSTSPSKPLILANLGSGGNDFEIQAGRHIHIDLVPGRLRNKLAIVARVEQLPLRNASVNMVLCVGSVINHGDAQEMISEIARVLQPNDLAVIEFDCADGLHQQGNSSKSAAITVNTFFNNRMLTLFEYSRSYIETELESKSLRIERRHSFHIASAFMLRFRVPPAVAAWFIYLDPLARFFKSLRYRGSNLLIVVRKI
jgi:hypothetical protein